VIFFKKTFALRTNLAYHIGVRAESGFGWNRAPMHPAKIVLGRKEHTFMSTSTLAHVRADQALRHSPIPALRRLHVEETEQDIVLSGSVSSYYLKQMAQETLMHLLGDRKLRNRVTVARS
jgi:hypothetical protein